MKKHFYFYSSKLENIKEIQTDKNFQSIYQYSLEDQYKAFQNEFGRIKTPDNYFHLLIGRGQPTGCAWCGSDIELKKISDDDSSKMSIYCVQCIKCYSRGQSLNVKPEMECDKESMRMVKNLLIQNYNERRPCDSGLINPYDII